MKKTIAITIVLSFIILKTLAQGDFGRVTPQTADFVRYGENSVSLNTGSFSYDVPIFTIKTFDFSMPISLHYTSDGFKPNKRPGCVGKDWILNAGGCITREIYLAPDDVIRTTQSDVTNFDLTGYNVCRNNGVYHSKDFLYFLSDPPFSGVWNGTKYIPYDGGWEDTMPDLFSFNMCGHSGSFVIDNDGSVMVSDKGYKVDISEMTDQPYEYNHADSNPGLPFASQIKITAPDGTIFTFGHAHNPNNPPNLSALEFSRSFDNQNVSEGVQFFGPAIINGWHLTSIATTHDTNVYFRYYNPDVSGLPCDNPSSIWQTTMTQKTINITNQPSVTVNSYSQTKSVLLESISVNDGTEVVFSNSMEEYNFYPNNGICGILTTGASNIQYDNPIFQLDSILIKYYDNIVHKYELQYEKGLRLNDHPLDDRPKSGIHFLEDVVVDDLYSYSFTYNHPSSNLYPYPVIREDDTDREGYLPNYNNGVLTRIDYPTGGYTTLEYEEHDFGKRVDRVSTSTFGTPITSLNENPPENIIGGLRIKRIENLDTDNSLLSFKEYYYVSDTIFPINEETAEKSGIYLHYPPYYIDDYSTEILLGSSISSFSKNYNISEPHIAYSNILEYNGDEMGYKCYSFTDYADFPDVETNNIQGTPSIMDPLLLIGMNKLNSSSRKRGLLKETQHYNKNGLLVGSEKNIYDGLQKISPANPNPPRNVIGVHSIAGGAVAKKIEIDKLLLVGKESKMGTNSPEEAIAYEYNDYDLINKVTRSNSNGKETAITTKYACDMTGTVYESMKSFNRISYPIEILTEIEGVETEKQKNVYKSNGKDIAEKQISLGGNTLQTIISYDEYDDRGRILQATNKDGVISSYVWRDDRFSGLEDKQTIHYPVAEIINATYNTVEQKIIDFMLVGPNLSAGYINYSDIGILRDEIPNALITTYTYKPLVGISSSTDPRGITTYYEYDDFNRLKETYIIESGTKKILQKYDYKYKQ